MSVTAVENIVKKVVGEVGEEVKAMLGDGLNSSSEILEAAKKETMVEVEKIHESTKRQAETLRLRMLSSAELIARNKSLEFFEQTINEIFQKALEKLGKITSSNEYKASIKKLLEEGIDAIASKDLIISANKKDSEILKAIIKEIAEEKGLNMKLDTEPIDCVGGVQVRSFDGTIFYDNTIEARLERFKPLLRKNIALLFMGKE